MDETLQVRRGVVDPEYFSLGVRRAFRQDNNENGGFPDDYLDGHEEPSVELLIGEYAALTLHPEVVEAANEVTSAELAVLAAEDAGVSDELAMRRLDKARAAERAVLVRLQRRRALGHTARSSVRAAVVVPLHAARSARARRFGGAA